MTLSGLGFLVESPILYLAFLKTIFSFIILTKNKKGVRAIRATEYKKYGAGKYTRARAPLARKYTNRIFKPKDDTTSTNK